MATGTEGSDERVDVAPASLIDALLVYVEPLASDAYAIVIGDCEGAIAERLLELGARGVQVFDPDPARAMNAARAGAPRGVTYRALADGLELRDGAYDLAIATDLSELDDAGATIARLRRAITSNGAVVAMGRARLDDGIADGERPFEAALGSATLTYGELYDLFAAQFEDVSLAGVVPFAGVVFAELGGTEEEAPAVSVDTRLAPSPAPSVFVVVASQSAPGEAWDDRRRQRPPLDPYAIVQIPKPEEGSREETIALEAALAATQLKAELLSAQLEEARGRLVASDGRTSEAVSRLDRVSSERDSALTRAMELETVLAASQQTMAILEQRMLETEQAMLERDAGLAHVIEAHAAEAAAYEEQLRERAGFVAELEKELVRREQIVKELVASLEESRAECFEVAAPPPPPPPHPDPDLAMIEVARLRNKLDELASEVARRDGELTARAWRIAELDNERARLLAEAEQSAKTSAASGPPSPGEDDERDLTVELARALSELDALRQAFAQEHAARVAAESGEELVQARSELARQAVLLEQVRGRVEGS